MLEKLTEVLASKSLLKRASITHNSVTLIVFQFQLQCPLKKRHGQNSISEQTHFELDCHFRLFLINVLGHNEEENQIYGGV